MLDRLSQGELPDKPHTAFRDAAGALRYEHCLTREAFDGPYTVLYREHRPHAQVPVKSAVVTPPIEASPRTSLLRRHFRTSALPRVPGPAVGGGTPLLFNADVVVRAIAPTEEDPVYVSYHDADVLYFVLEGGGVLRSELGDLPFEALDYVCVPKGVVHRIVPTPGRAQRYLRVDCTANLGLLRKHRNPLGQLRMDAPYGHRDFRRPVHRGPLDEGIRDVVVVGRGGAHAFRYRHSPLDVVGWDGTVYPWAFPILRFAPRVGLVHLPPDVHGTFEARGLLVSSFVPRPLDFHPEAVPCPYPHSSVDCDEVIFYARGEFTSRRGVEAGSLSFHPSALAHGPHPGAYEASLGKTRAEELAVMLDAFGALRATTLADAIEDPGYHMSFADGAS